MTAFDAYDLLVLWEREQSGLPEAEKALLLCALASPKSSREEIGAMSIGTRDRILLSLRRDLFGQELEALSSCTECNEQLEVTLRINELLAAGSAAVPAPHASIQTDEIEVMFRLPTTDDALALARSKSDDDPQWRIVRHCILSAKREGSSVAVDVLDDSIYERIAASMEALDPMSEIRLDLVCSECESPQSLLLEIGAYLWTELVNEAERLLEDVFLLAREYGWREADILAMSGQRRQFYLDRRMG